MASAACVLCVIGIGVWLIYENYQEKNGAMWMQVIGKISMTPLLVTATVFCANQYSKQKKLLEDYSYKLTLARSMVAFSEELREKDSEKYREYLAKVLSEIHQDPLRYRVDPNRKNNTSSLEKGLESMGKIAENISEIIGKKM